MRRTFINQRSFRAITRAMLLAGGAMAFASAHAAEASAEEMEDETTRTAREIVVQAEIGFRNRAEDGVEPKLVYDEEYFRRFEPLSAGDALKRVPSVTFLSDVIESDGARLRGLDPGYTQILINGERVPGSNADRSFFLDRVPAELIKQVEIVRSNSARRTGDAVAGTLNIVLRDAFSLDGGYVRGGAIRFDDGKIKPNGGLYYGGALGPGRLLIGANIQGRYNPKIKQSFRYGDSPENNPNFAVDDFDNREDQTDVRDGTDYAGNISWAMEQGGTKFEIAGNYVRTDRNQIERSFEYDDLTAMTGPINLTADGNLLSDNYNPVFIRQDSLAVSSKFSHETDWGKTSARASFANFRDRTREFEHEIDFDTDEDPAEYEGVFTRTEIDDSELAFELEQSFKLSDKLTFSVGGFMQDKNRRTRIAEAENDGAEVTAYNQLTERPDRFDSAFGDLESTPGGFNRIIEERRDLYALIEGNSGVVKFEAGVRWENTSVRITDFTADPADAQARVKYNFLLPSASVRIDLGRGRITASVARTVRRPRFDFITPALLETEYGDNDLQGNPLLRPEKAWGGDLGYEHKIGRTGVVGVNVFYRKIKDVVELTNTGEEGSEGEGTFVLVPRNTGSGEVWGVEFDLSASLSFVGLSDTGVFGNVSLINSSIRDDFGVRRFNGQSRFVYNAGVIQNFPRFGGAIGATYRKQGPAQDRIVGEEIRTSYGADLEVFIEKRFGKSFTLRAVGSNLLNGRKDEVFNKFDTIGDQQDRSFDEYELESEKAGPVFQIVARYAF
jgi:iron complex outermembrane recepter protein